MQRFVCIYRRLWVFLQRCMGIYRRLWVFYRDVWVFTDVCGYFYRHLVFTFRMGMYQYHPCMYPVQKVSNLKGFPFGATLTYPNVIPFKLLTFRISFFNPLEQYAPPSLKSKQYGYFPLWVNSYLPKSKSIQIAYIPYIVF